MEWLIFLKPLVDMVYAISVLDYLLMGIVTVLVLFSVKKYKSIQVTDVFALIFILLLVGTLLRTGEGVTHFVKIASAFVLYFLGRAYYEKSIQCERALIVSNKIVLLTNIVVLLIGGGYVVWGNAMTFKGVYFYKTDFGIAMIYCAAVCAFLENKRGLLTGALWVITGYLVFISNTRAAMVIYLIVLEMYMLYVREQRTGKLLRLNLSLMIKITIALVAGVLVIVKVLSLPQLQQFNFISFNLDNPLDFFNNTSNTQGRNIIWAYIFDSYRSAGLTGRLFGIDFVSDMWNGLDSHNTYLKILYSTGITGLSVFILFIISYMISLRKVKDRSIFYFTLALTITFLLQSISQATIDYTQMTWIYFFFIGCVVSLSKEAQQVEYNNPHEMCVIRIKNYVLHIQK